MVALVGVHARLVEEGRCGWLGVDDREDWQEPAPLDAVPRAVARALPTLNGEMVLQLKSTPLVATITDIDLYAVTSKIRQATYIMYEPLLLLALIYLCLTGVMVTVFRYIENKNPTRDA